MISAFAAPRHSSAGLKTLSRPLARGLDPVALCDSLASGGRRPWLFERPGARTLLVVAAALTVEARDTRVSIVAHTPLGRQLLAALAWRFQPRFAGAGTDRLDLAFALSHAHDSDTRLKAPSPFDVLRALSFDLSWEGEVAPMLAGVLGFDHVDAFEDLPPRAGPTPAFPDMIFALAEQAVVIETDGSARAVQFAQGGEGGAELDALVAAADAAPDLPPHETAPMVEATANLSDTAYADLVRTMQAHVFAGDVFQVVPSRAFAAPCADPFAAYRRLRDANPSPAMFYFEHPDWTLFGASPETAVRVSAGPDGLLVEVHPMAGTRRRGANPAEDTALEDELRADMKEVAEHMMLVDLARNDIARVSEPGTRRVDTLMEVKRFARVMHLASRVTGRLRADLDALHALAAGMNMGTLTGAPKIEAMKLLRHHEPGARGAYGGAVGWIAADGTMDTAIVIRSALVEDGIATVRAGAGVVADSIPEAEADETRIKASSVLAALGATR